MSRHQRVAVVGNSGSGKTTLAREIAERLGCEHIELDAIHHLPDWQPRDRAEMRRIVDEKTSTDRFHHIAIVNLWEISSPQDLAKRCPNGWRTVKTERGPTAILISMFIVKAF